MMLKTAFTRAKNAVCAEKADTLRRHVCLEFTRERKVVTVSDGNVTTQYRITQPDLPDNLHTCVSIDQVTPALAQAFGVSVEWSKDGATLVMTTYNAPDEKIRHVAHVNLNVLPPSQFKAHVHPTDLGEPIEADSSVASVKEFVGDDPAAPQYHCVYAHKDGVCATDMSSAVCVQKRTPWDGLLPKALFQHWPSKHTIHLLGNSAGAVVDIGDYGSEVVECRYANYVRHKNYPKVWDRLQPHERLNAPYAIVDTAPFVRAIKQATGCSKRGFVWLTHHADCLFVQADTELGGHAFNAKLPCSDYNEQSEQPACYDGKRLMAALKSASTPAVLLSQPHRNAALRIEGGNIVACVWRMNLDLERTADGPGHR